MTRHDRVRASRDVPGILAEVKVFLTLDSARNADRKWLKEHGIEDDAHREGKAQNETEFIVQECELKP